MDSRQNKQVSVAVRSASAQGAARRACYGAAFLVGGFGLSVLHAAAGVGAPCPFRAITGWQCPLCGGTRMGAALLEGHVSEAFRFNPLALIAVGVVAGLTAGWTLQALGAPRVRPAEAVITRLRRVPQHAWWAIGIVTAVVYTVLRNLS